MAETHIKPKSRPSRDRQAEMPKKKLKERERKKLFSLFSRLTLEEAHAVSVPPERRSSTPVPLSDADIKELW